MIDLVIRIFNVTNMIVYIFLFFSKNLGGLIPIPGVKVVDCTLSGLDSIQREGDVHVRVESVAPRLVFDADASFKFHELTFSAEIDGGNAIARELKELLNLKSFDVPMTATVKTSVSAT